MHLVQIAMGKTRRAAVVREPHLTLLRQVDSVLALVQRSLADGRALTEVAEMLASDEEISYDEVYEGRSGWKLLAPIDCPGDPRRVLVSGTGLTHLGSARERQAMHVSTPEEQEEMTDSMRMFEWGIQRGKPPEGTIGVAPEWFYKGDGSVLRGPSAALEIPGHAEDGGEEAEVAAVYYVAENGIPWRIGMTAGNEFSDHVFERRNYLNLAGSKLRPCSIGPELVVDAAFDDVAGQVRIGRDEKVLWEMSLQTGEQNMCHSLANLEHHHFKFAGQRQPGMLHVHFLGADRLSFGEGIRLQPGDVTEVRFEGFGRPLRNIIAREFPVSTPVRVRAMR
ncbi:MAG TPA: AraD1 family protein [Acidobacteriaceae bacterium]|nr:AraD1 family protein [Acidobacteriaceae bacterium]